MSHSFSQSLDESLSPSASETESDSLGVSYWLGDSVHSFSEWISPQWRITSFSLQYITLHWFSDWISDSSVNRLLSDSVTELESEWTTDSISQSSTTVGGTGLMVLAAQARRCGWMVKCSPQNWCWRFGLHRGSLYTELKWSSLLTVLTQEGTGTRLSLELGKNTPPQLRCCRYKMTL